MISSSRHLLGALLTAVVVALCAGATHAQAPPDTAVAMQVEMEPVEVTATPFRIANEAASFSVSTRTRTDVDLNTTPSLSLEAVTAGLPGLSVQSRTHFALGDRITVRGFGWRAQFGVRGIQMVLDGIPLTVADGQSVVHVIDPSFVRSVEVLRGPASTFWGNASGGVLALSTQPQNASHTVRLKETVGSYGLSKTDVQVTPDLGDHQFSAYGSYLTQEGFRQHSDTRLLRAGVTSDWSLGADRGVRVVGALQHMPRADSPGSLAREAAQQNPEQARATIRDFDVGKDVQQSQIGATYYDDVGLGTLNATAYGVLRDLRNPIPFSVIDLDRRAGGVRLTLEDRTSDVRWGVGVEGKLQHDDRMEFESDGGRSGDVLIDQLETVDNAATFGRFALPLGRLQLDAGLRYDWLRFEADDRTPQNDDGTQTFRALSPSVGLSFDLGTARLFANASTGLEAPTTSELSNRPDAQGGFNDLAAEDVLALEGGVTGRWIGPRLSYDVALFYQDVDDVLVPFQLQAFGPTYFRNQGAARHVGGEVALQWQPTDRWDVQASYSYTDAQFTAGTVEGPDATTALDGNQLPGVPPHRLGGTLQLRTDVVHAATTVQHVGEQYGDSENTATIDAYTTIDLRLSHPGIPVTAGTKVTPFVALNNAFDARYSDVVVNAFGGRFYEPAAGRHWRFGASLQVD